jgi:hypothetical protein
MRFAHYSVKEYLVSERISNVVSSFRIVDSAAHELFARISLVYLLSFDGSTATKAENLEALPLLRYAAQFWPTHLHASTDKGVQMVEFTLARRIFERQYMANWLGIYNPDDNMGGYPFSQFLVPPVFGPPLYYSSLLGLTNVTEWLCQTGDVNAQGGNYGNALQAACRGGHKDVVQLLLENDADVNAQGGHYGNALQAACSGGHKDVVQLLLENDADVNAQGGYYGNALQAACRGGHKDMVQLLLENGAVHYDQSLNQSSDIG